MAFSITVNGTAYTEADFGASNYFLNFPRFLRDCTEHYANSLTSYATSYGVSFTPANIHVAPGKAFYPGMPIVFYNSRYTNLYFCTVLTYSSGSGAMTCTVHDASLTMFSEERADWWCAAGAAMHSITGSYTGLTSLGYTTVADVKLNSGQGLPATRLADHFEDFTGYFPDVEENPETGGAISTALPGIMFSVTGGGKISSNMNQLQSFCSSDCPGVVELSVSGKPDAAAIVGKGTNYAKTNHYTTFRVFIPDSVEGEEIELHIGCSSSNTVFAGVDGIPAAFLSFNSLSLPFKKKKLIEARYQSNVDILEQASGGLFSQADTWDQGRWLCINFTKLASGLYSATVSDDLGTSVYTPTFPAAPTIAPVFAQCYPFILLTKKKGSKASKVYVDYIGSGNRSTTRPEDGYVTPSPPVEA